MVNFKDQDDLYIGPGKDREVGQESKESMKDYAIIRLGLLRS